MKGYLLKDIYLYRKNFICFFIGILLLSAPVFAKPPVESFSLSLMLLCVFCTCIFLVLDMCEQSIYENDESNEFKKFTLSSPSAATGYIGAKYILTLCISLFFIIYCMALSSVASVVHHHRFKIFWLCLMYFSIMLFFRSLEIPLIIRFGSKSGGIYRTFISFVFIFTIFVYLLFGDISIFGSMEQILSFVEKLLDGNMQSFLRNISLIMFFVSAVLYLISYRISKRLYKCSEQ